MDRALDGLDAPVVPVGERLLDDGRDELGRREDGALSLLALGTLDLAQRVVLDHLEDQLALDVVLTRGEKKTDE